jgi:hypothetical protein
MKKLFLGLAAASILMAACKHAQPNNATAVNLSAVSPVMSDGAAMKFEYETHDFGKIHQGDKVTYKFNFANVGKSPLIISNATASCGCTKPEWPTTPIKPGDGGQIVVTFNSAGKTGLQDKQIVITANTNPAQSIVHLVGEVVAK